jgi:hypothetical protein
MSESPNTLPVENMDSTNPPRNSPVSVSENNHNLPVPPTEEEYTLPPAPPSDDEKEEEPVEEKVEEPVEEKVEEPVEEKVEEPVEEKVEEPVEEKVEEPLEEKVSKLPPLEIPEFNEHITNVVDLPPLQPATWEEAKEKANSEKFFTSDDDLRNDIKTLSQCISILLVSNDDLNKYSLVIDKKTRAILENLLDVDSKYFDTIEELFKSIIQDDKIDANDVPLVMNLLVELYLTLKTKQFTFSLANCGEVLKVIFTVLIKEKIIPINEKEAELLRCLYNIIEMSVHLSQTGDDSNGDGLFSCLKGCF